MTDVQEEEEEEMTCVEMIDATTGPARHLIPHANDNQTNSKRPLHEIYITDARDSPEVNSSTDKRKKRDNTTFDDNSPASICENPYNILLKKHQQAPGATISSLVKFKSFINTL